MRKAVLVMTGYTRVGGHTNEEGPSTVLPLSANSYNF